MPVRLPHTALYRCPACTAHASSRAFSASAGRSALGPESPRYIDIPQPPQQTVPDKIRLKGILPVPRDVFAGQDPFVRISFFAGFRAMIIEYFRLLITKSLLFT